MNSFSYVVPMFRYRFSVFLAALFVSFNLVFPAALKAQEVVIPNFWDKHERFQRPELDSLARLRFLTTTDFPPFNFIDRKKRLAGFHIDLVRSICAELNIIVRCQIQALPWNELSDELKKGNAEAIIAGLQINAETRKEFEFTNPYLAIPARFVVRNDAGMTSQAYTEVFKKLTGVVKGSAHKTYFEERFSTRTFKEFDTREDAFKALMEEEIQAVFVDALSASFWLQSDTSGDCCRFLDGAFNSVSHFGNGMAIAVSKDQTELAEALNFALYRINANGKFAELYLRYFPLGLF